MPEADREALLKGGKKAKDNFVHVNMTTDGNLLSQTPAVPVPMTVPSPVQTVGNTRQSYRSMSNPCAQMNVEPHDNGAVQVEETNQQKKEKVLDPEKQEKVNHVAPGLLSVNSLIW